LKVAGRNENNRGNWVVTPGPENRTRNLDDPKILLLGPRGSVEILVAMTVRSIKVANPPIGIANFVVLCRSDHNALPGSTGSARTPFRLVGAPPFNNGQETLSVEEEEDEPVLYCTEDGDIDFEDFSWAWEHGIVHSTQTRAADTERILPMHYEDAPFAVLYSNRAMADIITGRSCIVMCLICTVNKHYPYFSVRYLHCDRPFLTL
jgi:hypothetical protein